MWRLGRSTHSSLSAAARRSRWPWPPMPAVPGRAFASGFSRRWCSGRSFKGYEYAVKFTHHIFPSTNIFWACYFTLTGVHALHVVGGLGLHVYVLLLTAGRSWEAKRHRLELSGLYWHFVDIVWIFLFPLLYLF